MCSFLIRTTGPRKQSCIFFIHCTENYFSPEWPLLQKIGKINLIMNLSICLWCFDSVVIPEISSFAFWSALFFSSVIFFMSSFRLFSFLTKTKDTKLKFLEWLVMHRWQYNMESNINNIFSYPNQHFQHLSPEVHLQCLPAAGPLF